MSLFKWSHLSTASPGQWKSLSTQFHFLYSLFLYCKIQPVSVLYVRSFYGKNMSATLTIVFVSLSYRKGSGQPWSEGSLSSDTLIINTSVKVTRTDCNTYTLTLRRTHTPTRTHTLIASAHTKTQRSPAQTQFHTQTLWSGWGNPGGACWDCAFLHA